MKWLSRLELKYGRYAIRNLTLYIVGLNLTVFLISFFLFAGNPLQTISIMALIPQQVFKGEIWRLFTFLFLPESYDFFFALLSIYITYMIGSSVENYWGKARFNAFYFCGALLTILAAFLSGYGLSGFYLNMSLFLAFATLFPEQEILLFFVLPVKAKYLGIAEAVYVLYMMFQAIRFGGLGSPVVAAALASFVNYFIFFGNDFFKWIRLRMQVHNNRKRYFEQVRPYNRNRPPY